MQLLSVKKLSLTKSITMFLGLVLMASTLSSFAGKKETYTETQFLDSFSGKSKKVILQKLGEPAKKELSVKPSGAGAYTAKMGKEEKSKPVKVEMWYYNHIVNYDPKHTYKETEITFVNDRAMNIAFFNNR
jgi:hypothetical protein